MPEPLFVDHQAAARSLKNAWTRMASTYRCIQVTLYQEHLTVKSRPLIGWLISLLRLDLDHQIPLSKIEYALPVGEWDSRPIIQVRFLGDNGESNNIILYLARPAELIQHLKTLGVPVLQEPKN